MPIRCRSACLFRAYSRPLRSITKITAAADVLIRIETELTLIGSSILHKVWQEHLTVPAGYEEHAAEAGPSGENAALLPPHLQPAVRELRCQGSGPQAYAGP